MSTLADSHLMSDAAFERYLKRHRITGLAAAHAATKRRAKRERLKLEDSAAYAATLLSSAPMQSALVESARNGAELGSCDED